MTIEELRRARLAAKLEAMGGMGGYAEAKCKAEVEAEAKAEESPFFDPPVEIEPTRSTLDPPRRKLLRPLSPLHPLHLLRLLERPRATRKIWPHFERRTSNPSASVTERRSTSLTRLSKG